MLKQWLPVNTLVREKFRNIIIKHIQLKMDESFNDARKIFERNPDSGKVRSREPMNYGTEQMVNPAVNSVPDDGVCEGEYVRTTYPTQEEIIEFNKKENTVKDEYKRNIPELHLKDDKIMVLVEKDLLENLKDFDYWKEWKHQ